MNWISVIDRLPEPGILCAVFLPVGKNSATGKIIGPTAMAYYREDEGWVYADIPSKLRFTPYYWQPFEEEF